MMTDKLTMLTYNVTILANKAEILYTLHPNRAISLSVPTTTSEFSWPRNDEIRIQHHEVKETP
jgi:hypothetical protein